MKKEWITPQVEVISNDVIKVGTVLSYPESVMTVVGGIGADS